MICDAKRILMLFPPEMVGAETQMEKFGKFGWYKQSASALTVFAEGFIGLAIN